MQTEEQVASEGLDITGFAGKWRKAQEIVTRNKDRVYEDGRDILPYWERVRLMFLELGGEFIGQKYGERH